MPVMNVRPRHVITMYAPIFYLFYVLNIVRSFFYFFYVNNILRGTYAPFSSFFTSTISQRNRFHFFYVNDMYWYHCEISLESVQTFRGQSKLRFLIHYAAMRASENNSTTQIWTSIDDKTSQYSLTPGRGNKLVWTSLHACQCQLTVKLLLTIADLTQKSLNFGTLSQMYLQKNWISTVFWSYDFLHHRKTSFLTNFLISKNTRILKPPVLAEKKYKKHVFLIFFDLFAEFEIFYHFFSRFP
jgi:hypothetical protein